MMSRVLKRETKCPAGDQNPKAAEKRFGLIRGKRAVNSVAYDGSQLLFTIEAEEPVRVAEHIMLGVASASLQGLHDGAPKA